MKQKETFDNSTKITVSSYESSSWHVNTAFDKLYFYNFKFKKATVNKIVYTVTCQRATGDGVMFKLVCSGDKAAIPFVLHSSDIGKVKTKACTKGVFLWNDDLTLAKELVLEDIELSRQTCMRKLNRFGAWKTIVENI